VRVSENGVLREIFGPKRDEVTQKWRKLHNEELSDLYCLSNIVRVIKSKKIRRTGHVAYMGERRDVYWWVNQRERDHLEDPGVDGRKILRWIFRKWDVGVRTGSICLRKVTGSGEVSMR